MKLLYTWGSIAVLVLASTAGDVLISAAMKGIGDLQELRARCGLFHVIKRVIGNTRFLSGIGCMTVAFFSLQVALSWADLSLVGPASASLTFIANALTARVFLKERVDYRRWAAMVLVACGVALLAH
jgi:drug/metabolite transporter (DMT)-like permease